MARKEHAKVFLNEDVYTAFYKEFPWISARGNTKRYMNYPWRIGLTLELNKPSLAIKPYIDK